MLIYIQSLHFTALYLSGGLYRIDFGYKNYPHFAINQIYTAYTKNDIRFGDLIMI